MTQPRKRKTGTFSKTRSPTIGYQNLIERILFSLNIPMKTTITTAAFLFTCILVALPAACFSRDFSEPLILEDQQGEKSFHLSISGGLISLHARDAELRDILEEISSKTGVEITIFAPLESKISISFENLPLGKALEMMTSNRCVVFSAKPGGRDFEITRVAVFPDSAREVPAKPDDHPADTTMVYEFPESLSRSPGTGQPHESSRQVTVMGAKDGRKSRVVSNELIVRFKSGVSREEIHALIARMGATAKRHLEAIDYYVLSLPRFLSVSEALKWCRNRDIVEKTEPNYLIPLQQDVPPSPDDPYLKTYQWPLHNTGQTGGPQDADVDALEAWEIDQGNPWVVIAVIDTGIDYDHPDLGANIWQNDLELEGEDGVDDDGNGYVDDVMGWDFVDEDDDPKDEHGHGTHVAGIAGAVTDNGIGVAGLAWHCRIMPVRAGDSRGIFTSEHAAQAIIYAAENGAHVINLSWGGYEKISLIDDAMTFATNGGALICAAAGNDDSSNLIYPAAYRNDAVIAVGATNDEDRKAGFSNYGNWVHVSAPGDGPAIGVSSSRGIYSTYLDGTYRQRRGTSMATPHVAGTAALLFSHFQDMSALEARTRIMRSADVIEDLDGVNMTSGRINVYRALTEEYHTPHVFSIRPDAAHEGDRVFILGDRFGEDQTAERAVVFEPALEGEIMAWSHSAIVSRVPAGARTGEIKVMTPEGVSNGIPIAILLKYYDEESVESRFQERGTPMGWHADDGSWAYTLPFSFPFFGLHYDSLYVCSNGFLIFEDNGFSSYENSTGAFRHRVMIAPLWDDLSTIGSSGEDIYIGLPSEDAVSFRWAGKRYGSNDRVNVEAVLHKDGGIEFSYGMGNKDLSPTVGISGGDGDRYHLSVHDENSSLDGADTVLFTPTGNPQPPKMCASTGNDGDSNCFIATAAFGASGAGRIRTLRAFRDRHLKACALGRFLVRVYERYSPPLAHFIAEHETLRPVFRIMLVPWVVAAGAVLSLGVKAALCILTAVTALPCLLVFVWVGCRRA